MIRFGLLSTARVNRSVLDASRVSDAFEIVAVASRNRQRADVYAREHQIERSYGVYDELLDDPDVDAVYISLPNTAHVEWTRRALRAGRHVLCEKPLTRRSAEAEDLFDVAGKAGCVLTEGFMYRHHPQTRRLRELIADGSVGRLRAIRAFFSFDALAQHEANDIRFQSDLDGGALLDMGCYCVNIIRHLAGEPYAVMGQRVPGPSGVDADFLAIMVLPNDVVAEFFCSFRLPLRQELEIVGDEGLIHVGAPWLQSLDAPTTLRRGEAHETFKVEPFDAYQLELEDVCRAIESGEPPLLGREDAVGQARVLEALWRSADEGQRIAI